MAEQVRVKREAESPDEGAAAAKRVKAEPQEEEQNVKAAGSKSSTNNPDKKAEKPVQLKKEPPSADGNSKDKVVKVKKEQNKKNDQQIEVKYNGEIDANIDVENWATQKLDHQSRILLSINMLDAKVEESQAALYWICDARTLKKATSCISMICKKAAIRAHTDCIYITGMDEGRTCVCECKIGAAAFTKFQSKVDKFQLGIELETLQKVLAPFKEHDMVVFCMENQNDDCIKIQGYHTYKRNNEFAYLKVRLMHDDLADAIGLGVGLEDNDMWNLLEMSSSEFSEIFKDYKDLTTQKDDKPGVHKLVEVKYTVDKKFIVALPGDVAGVTGSTTLQEGGVLKMLKPPEPEEGDFCQCVNADYIAKFGPIGSAISDRVKLFMKDNYPFVVQFKDDKGHQANFYIIPRVGG